MKNAIMTIDVEDWFQVENLKSVINGQWDDKELRVEKSIYRLLEIFDRHGIKATFFVLGWIAERCPSIVKEIAAQDHEIASHGYMHQLIYQQNPNSFRSDLLRSKIILEDIIQKQVIGYRAPSFSITNWAIDILKNEGFIYDSSYYDFGRHDRYGKLDISNSEKIKGANIYVLSNGVFEIPMSTLNILNKKIPISGGGYFRIIPYFKFIELFKKSISQNGTSIFYLHPWEIDENQPRVKGLKANYSFRHYCNISKTFSKLERLLKSINFYSIEEIL
jgi:polysaccharide deacetylase family protein (PEP-CTERM system associated)